MTHSLLSRAARLALAAAAAIAPLTMAPLVGATSATAVSAFASCAQVRAADATAADGEYAITVFAKTVTVHCADMATAPAEYLTLPTASPTTNFSGSGSSQRHFQRVRLLLPADAVSPFRIITTDVRFSVAQYATPASYGYAMGCYFVPVNANVDLRGTPFGASAASFTRSGTAAQGTVVASSGGQVIDIVGATGDCGWIQSANPLPLTWLASAPVVTSGPADQTAVVGADATFTLAVTGSPVPDVRWESSTDGVTFTPIAGATSATLVLPGVTALMDGLVVRAVLDNEQGSVTSGTVTLTVVPAPPTVTDPADAAVTWGDDATFTVTTAGDPAPTVHWEQSTDGGVAWTPISGATTPQLVLAAVTTADDGLLVRAVATGPGGTATSAPATLTVTALPPTIVTGPIPATVVAGQGATFTVAVTGTPVPTVQWQTSPDGVTWTSVPGATGATFFVPEADIAQSGLQVRAVVTSLVGTVTSTPVVLTVTAPPVVMPPVVTPPVVTPPVAAPGAGRAAPSAAGSARGALAATGLDAGAPLGLAGVLLLAGSGAVVVSRRLGTSTVPRG
jgi:hypothetical protein